MKRPSLLRMKFSGRPALPLVWLSSISIAILVVVLSFASPPPAMSAFVPPQEPPPTGEIGIPTQADWTDHGVVVSEGSKGSWDVRLGGAISPSSVVKKDGVYYLYYIGADGNRSADGGPRHRALGVATSTDGINFTKYSGNPVITHLPHNNQEEGIFSAGATLDGNGDIVVYYGALWASNSTTENVDIYIGLAVSSDGLNFTDKGYVRRVGGARGNPYRSISG